MTGNHLSVAAGAVGQCMRCAGLGTHYLTCPVLRLPRGYRVSEDPAPGTPVTAGNLHAARGSANG